MTDHDHHHHDDDHSELSETELRVRALETILAEKGYLDPAALDAIIQALRQGKLEVVDADLSKYLEIHIHTTP